MIVLDTNVVSETLRPSPNQNVVRWLYEQTDALTITATTLAELRTGLQLLPEGRRREQLQAALVQALAPFRDSAAILPFDEGCTQQFAQLVAARQQAGRPIHTADAQIAAICLRHGATLATRNGKDFAGTGVQLINPWVV